LKTSEVGYNYFLYFGYIGYGVSVILLFLIICNYNKIAIAIKIMQTAADFVTEVCFVTLVPPVLSACMFGWVFIWINYAI
jgi:hypothetical protein